MENLKKTTNTVENMDALMFCLECSEFVQVGHEHKEKTLILMENADIGWVVSTEGVCSFLFQHVKRVPPCHLELDQPFYLHKLPENHPRCHVCSDGTGWSTESKIPLRYWSLDCYRQGEAADVPTTWLSTMVSENFGDHLDAFCFTCQCGFNHDKDDHEDHKYLHVHTDKYCPCIEIPHDHFFSKAWSTVQEVPRGEMSSSKKNRLLKVKDERRRCQGCNIRLEGDGEKTCSWECMLSLLELRRI